MAERNSTSKARPGRKLSGASRERSSRASRERASDEKQGSSEVENSARPGLTRLMQAEAVLGCISFALMYADWREDGESDYAGAVEVALDLVKESIRSLDVTEKKSSEQRRRPKRS
jgi:hypothetical protein